MPSYQIIQILIRVGLALGAGILIALVPFYFAKARYALTIRRRITFFIVSVFFLACFIGYMLFLWNRFVPKNAPPPPPPATYPTVPLS
ncbi:MAG: hypothetical protein LBN38_04550 [Verrucomicrobiota bacterium]|jgi:hypothetical protein|nr:hypothetical protein [Verrucomicrobiota bacterium]